MRTRVCLTHLGGGYEDSSQMAPWVREDLDILAERMDPRAFLYGSRTDVPRLASVLLASDVSLNWFAWDNALWSIRLGRWFRVPGLVILAGFDVANEPDFAYGALRTAEGRAKVRSVLKGAAHVFALSEFVRESALNVAPNTPIETVPLGFDAAEFPPGPEPAERHAVCTIGDVGETNLKRKGILDVIEVARHLDDIPVFVAGKISPNLRNFVNHAPPNVTFLDHVPKETLVKVLQDSRVYLQLSRHEGFGAAVAEAMLCRCIPVLSRAGALPEVAGNAGQYVELGNAERIAEVVRRVFESGDRADAARQRVIETFPQKKRRDLLLRRVEEAVSKA